MSSSNESNPKASAQIYKTLLLSVPFKLVEFHAEDVVLCILME